MNLSDIFPREAPASESLGEGKVWGPVVIEDPRVEIPSLGCQFGIENNVASWIGTDDWGRGFKFKGSPREADNGLIFTHAEDPVEITVRPLNDGDWKNFGNGDTEMSMEEIYQSADAMFTAVDEG